MREASIWTILFVNVILAAVWHFMMFIACLKVKLSRFDPKLRFYQAKSWEKNGRWYSKYLKINAWKDHLPQHTGKDGFTKEHMENHITLSYLDRFIMETCRGEWDHWMCSLYMIVSLIINPFWIGLLLGILVLVGNLPFIAIQRYNRFRLQTLRKRMLREQERIASHSGEVLA